MQSPILCLAIFLWGSYTVHVNCNAIHVGNSSREISEIFGSTTNGGYDYSANVTVSTEPSQDGQTPSTSRCSNKVDLPDITTMLLNLQSDLAAVSNIVKHNNAVLLDIGNETRTIAANTRLILASVNGLRSRSGDTNAVDQLQNDIKQISVSIGRINKKIDDAVVNSNNNKSNKAENDNSGPSFADVVKTCIVKSTPGKEDNIMAENTPVSQSAPEKEDNIADENASITQSSDRYTVNPAKKPELMNNINTKHAETIDENSTTVHIHIEPEENVKKVNKVKKNKNTNYLEKYQSKTHKKKFEHNRHNDHRPSGDNFIAVKKKRITSYYVGNIDPYVSENDIAQYLTDSGVRMTFIKMFHGKNGSAAKVNIPDNFSHIVESDDFWPEETIVRRWKGKRVLQSSYTHWKDIVNEYAMVNGTSHVQTFIINDTAYYSVDDIQSILDLIKSKNIVAFVGRYDKLFAIVTDHLRIPYLITSMVPWDKEKTFNHIHMIPGVHMYASSIRDLFEHFKWREAGILYDTYFGSEIAALMMEHRDSSHSLYDIRAYDVLKNSTADVVRWALKHLRKNHVTNFLIVCSPETTDIVLTQALYLSLLSRPNSWLVVNMGAGDIALEKFIDSRANLTLLRLMVDPLSPDCALNDSEISLTKAIYHDVFRIINDTKFDRSEKDRVSRADIRRQVKTMDINGCTGNLNFTGSGERNETFLQILALEGLVNGASGTWRSGMPSIKQRVQPSRTYSTMLNEKDDIFADKVLRVTVTIVPPFVQWKNKTKEEGLKMGNDKFEGFCIDILEEIAKILNFKYNITRVPDGKFGSLKPPPRFWTGMIRELVDDRADIALAPFSITPDRSEAVDFTKPFMTKGTSVVVRKPERSVWPFQFLSPLSKIVWIAIFLSFIFVGLFLFGVTRILSESKTGIQTDLEESFWYVWGTLLRADLKGSPVATSGRILSATWWFFSLIIISIYTANLAAFLTITNAHIPISSAADLADQNEYDYGTVDGQQIQSFFEHTNIPHYEKMRAYLALNPSSLVRRVEDGFRRVLKEKYAFIWDSPRVRHETAKDCNLMEIGVPFDLKGYGIATQKHSKYSEPLSMAVLELNDNGVLYRLEGKWWRRPNCPDPRSNAKSKAIEIEVASGMFIVLLSGIALSTFVCVIQYLIKKKCTKCRKLLGSSREPEVQANHNHVASPSTVPDNPIEDTSVVLTRTLSIGEASGNSSRWIDGVYASANDKS